MSCSNNTIEFPLFSLSSWFIHVTLNSHSDQSTIKISELRCLPFSSLRLIFSLLLIITNILNFLDCYSAFTLLAACTFILYAFPFLPHPVQHDPFHLVFTMSAVLSHLGYFTCSSLFSNPIPHIAHTWWPLVFLPSINSPYWSHALSHEFSCTHFQACSKALQALGHFPVL